MAQLFTLKITDGVDTVDFLDGTNYAVANGGFNIGLPGDISEPVPYRTGPFFVPTMEFIKPRKAVIRFECIGTDRSDVIANLNKVRRIMRRAEARKRFGAGARVELQYAWKDADNITYFEVYGGMVSPSEDVLSVEKIHYQKGGKYRVPDCEANFYVSTYGYGISVRTGSPTEVPLYNPSIGSKQTGGVVARNIKNEPSSVIHYNYVEIAGVDLPGSEPYLCKVRIVGGGPEGTYIQQIYMGLVASPLPVHTRLIYESEDMTGYGGSWSQIADTYASGKVAPVKYSSGDLNITTLGIQSTSEATMSWQWKGSAPASNGPVGVFYAFMVARDGLPATLQYAVSVRPWITYGGLWFGDFVPVTSSMTIVPLGPVFLPPGGGKDFADLGVVGDFKLGISIAADATGSPTVTVDHLDLLPMSDGLRIIKANSGGSSQWWGSSAFVDDGWKGLLYQENSGYYWSNWLGLLEQIKLEPGIDQRLYFNFVELSTVLESHNEKSATIRVYVVPTYQALAS